MIRGIELYRGPSMLDGQEVVALLQFESSNRKTGPMCQTWILRADKAPSEAIDSGDDASVCGSCVHRHHTGGACYVSPVRMGPNAVWKGWRSGKYPIATPKLLRRIKGRPVRLGAYGDPAAIPVRVWQKVASNASFTTGYTHQVENADPDLMDLCMASVDSEAGALLHQREGHRTFRVKTSDEQLLLSEVLCPASTRDDIQCIDCGMCDAATGAGRSIAIDVHGQRKKRFQPIQVREVA